MAEFDDQFGNALMDFLGTRLSKEDLGTVAQMLDSNGELAQDVPPPTPGAPRPPLEGGLYPNRAEREREWINGTAMDSRPVSPIDATRRAQADLDFVFGKQAMAQDGDGAYQIYAAGFGRLILDSIGFPKSRAGGLFRQLAAECAPKIAQAQDTAPRRDGFRRLFPDAPRVRQG